MFSLEVLHKRNLKTQTKPNTKNPKPETIKKKDSKKKLPPKSLSYLAISFSILQKM